jgi:hypothetical protein
MKSGNLNFLEPSGPLQACNGTALPLPLGVCFDSVSAGQDTAQLHKITRSSTLIKNISHWPYPEQGQITPISQRQTGLDSKPVRV